MKPESDLNPYAAPQSAISDDDTSEMPASTKWTVFMLITLVVGWVGGLWSLAQGSEANVIRSGWYFHIRGIVCLQALLSILYFRQKKWSYYLGVLSLVWIVTTWLHRVKTLAEAIWEKDPLQAAMLATSALLLLLLFYRFTFGLPSRRFYRMTQK
ncbi:MAG: hypothetical protein K9N47_15290 [Prosthecobacter sp.]|uniref:hypothetical protein n=1 Tax=Prosthecobacter sp. TaxID=1965333 RepID=UPI0025D8835A|nr:hypothetical protein [Prosthecobacter sp.]MCF7787493.1 hypothetical protein [Prosthecobacter sp.]